MVLVAAVVAIPVQAIAATFTVTNLSDGAAPGPAGSLRAAIDSANTTPGADTIDFQPGLTGTILLNSGDLGLSDATGMTTITGPGANVLTVSGNHLQRVFAMGGVVEISGLTIADGVSSGGSGVFNGGTLTLRACVLRGHVTNSSPFGGAVHNGPDSTLAIRDCLFTENSGNYGAAIQSYSAIPAVLTNVTISGNTTLVPGGGVVECRNGGGSATGWIRLDSCTVTNNTTVNTGALYAQGSGVIEYRNTIVAGNTPLQFSSTVGILTSLGHNISSDGDGNLSVTGDLPNTNPLLGPLADNGGPTLTHALLSGSPAIDAGDPVTFPATDQRGSARPAAGAGCAVIPDIGAFEVQAQDCNNNFIPDACDIAAPHIYWSNDTSDLIQRAIALPINLGIQTVVSAGTGTATLRGVAVDPLHAKVFWSDAGANTIMQSNLDGSGSALVVPSPNGHARDITLDVAGSRMFWANGNNGTLYRADLNGGSVTPIVTGQDSPSGIALDLAGGKMYWVNQGGNAIRRANLDGTNIETLIGTGLTTPIDIDLDIPGGKMYWAEFGGSKIRRANLDGTGSQDLATTNLGSATSVALDLAAGKLYWSSASLNKIERANLDGTNRESVITGVGAIYRIAFIQRSADCNGNGTLDECEIHVPAEHVYAAAPGTSIPDGNPTGISSTINVPNGGVIADLDVFVNIPHTWQGDVIATLSHGGVTQTIINRVGLCFDPTWGYSAASFGPAGGYLVLDDSAPIGIDCYAGGTAGIPNYAGPAQPNQPLAAFDGQNPAGDWTLTVSDPLLEFVGTLATWALVLQTTVADCNGNGVPDDCEPNLHRGDMNCDCAINLDDVQGFIEAVLDPAAYTAAHPACSITNGDMQPDGQVNGLDIQSFVQLLAP